MGGLHVVILAGGVGSRLWPISRRSKPKQFQPLLSNRTMLQETYDRVQALTTPDRMWVVTGAEFTSLVQAQLPNLPPGNILGEPVGRSSGPAVALATTLIAQRDPNAQVLATPADSYIGDPEAYCDYVSLARPVAEQGFIVTLGVIPTRPDTGYGYIKRGARIGAEFNAYRVERFTEKPGLETAQAYLADGGYYWNMGQFLFIASHLLERLAVHLPEVAQVMQQAARLEQMTPEALAPLYARLPSVSFDYGLAEKETALAVVPTALDWSDVGTWRAIKEIAARRGLPESHTGRHLGVDSGNCFVLAQSGRLVVTVGVEGYVIVDTDDALLIVHEDRSQEVRTALEELERRGEGEKL